MARLGSPGRGAKCRGGSSPQRWSCTLGPARPPLEPLLRVSGPFLRASPHWCRADSGLDRGCDSAALKNILEAVFQASNSVSYLSSILLPWGKREKKAERVTQHQPTLAGTCSGHRPQHSRGG